MLNANRVNAIRARARRGWSIKEIVRKLGVSRKAVRRYLRRDQVPVALRPKPKAFERWELALARRIAGTARTTDHEELESVLTWHLAKLQHRRGDARDWRAFLTTALNRKALDWLVAQQKTGRNTTSLDESIGDGGDDRASSIPDAIGISPDDHLAFAQAREVLPKHLRRIWDALIAEGLNKTRAAKRLGVHRNSMTNAMPRIAKVLRDHGF